MDSQRQVELAKRIRSSGTKFYGIPPPSNRSRICRLHGSQQQHEGIKIDSKVAVLVLSWGCLWERIGGSKWHIGQNDVRQSNYTLNFVTHDTLQCHPLSINPRFEGNVSKLCFWGGCATFLAVGQKRVITLNGLNPSANHSTGIGQLEPYLPTSAILNLALVIQQVHLWTLGINMHRNLMAVVAANQLHNLLS